MRISVIGCGYLGAVHAAAMAELGHDVIGLEIDKTRAQTLASGEAPFHEPGLDELLSRNIAAGRLRFTTEPAELAGAALHFLAVGTPQQARSYSPDLSQLDAALAALLPHLSPTEHGQPVVVGKSTVPVGTAARIGPRVVAAGGVLVWSPEFLREGHAVQDTLTPDRLVYGLPEAEQAAEHGRQLLDEVHAELLRDEGTPRILTDYATAELVKVAANSFLATKVSYINAMVDLCEATGADVTQLADAIGLDERIGPQFLGAGIGFGGGCLPKDVRAFIARAEELGIGHISALLGEVEAINQHRRDRVVTLATDLLGGSVDGRRIAVLGAAFKPGTDDTRDSPALEVAHRLQGAGAQIRITDPQAGAVLAAEPVPLEIATDASDAARDADLVLLLTDWPQFKTIDPHELREVVAAPCIIDGRNALDPAAWQAAGWEYHGVGRGYPVPAFAPDASAPYEPGTAKSPATAGNGASAARSAAASSVPLAQSQPAR